MRRVLQRSILGAAFVLTVPASADEVPNGDGIGSYLGFDPARQTVTLGQDEVKLSGEANASLLEQIHQWRLPLAQKKPFRAKFVAENGVITSIRIEPREGESAPTGGATKAGAGNGAASGARTEKGNP